MPRRLPYLLAGALVLAPFAISLTAQEAKPKDKDMKSEAPAEPVKPLWDHTPPIGLADAKRDFTDPAALNDDAAATLKGLCSLADFRALPEADRFVYSFDPWPGASDSLDAKQFTFNFRWGKDAASSQKIAFIPTGGGPNSKATFARAREGDGPSHLKGLGNLDWGGKMTHTFKFNKPVTAFGVVLRSSGEMGLRKFYWAGNKEQNGFPLSYTLSDGTLVNLGERELEGARFKGETDSFLAVADRTGRGIVSVTYTLTGLAGNTAQSLAVSHLAFVTAPKTAVAPVINLRASHDFEAPENIVASPKPLPLGLATLEEFRFIVANKRRVYNFTTWPSDKDELGSDTAEFAFDTTGKGATDQKVTFTVKDAKLTRRLMTRGDELPFPVLSGLTDLTRNALSEHVIKFEKPVWAFGLTYRTQGAAQLASTTNPISYTLSDGSEVHLGKAGAPAGVLDKEGKTFVGAIDKSDKGIVSATIRLQGTASKPQAVVVEDIAFAFAGPPPGNWKLVLEDHFNGDKLDPKIWATGYKFVDVINNEYQAYVPENVVVADGYCTIKVEHRDAVNTDRNGNTKQKQKFASGAFTSFDKFTCTFGYFEARLKMPHPRGAGVWPAFWMLPDRGREYPDKLRTGYKDVGYGTGIEIDIFEFMPRWRRSNGQYPIHIGCIWSYAKKTKENPGPTGYGGYAKDNDGWGPGELMYTNPDTEFHTYGVYWSPERIIWYLDSKPIFRVKDPEHVPDVPHYFLFNIALSGNGWGKSEDKKHPTMEEIIADMPNSMVIDYFRAYSGTLDEAIPASPTDDPTIVPKYNPPPQEATAEATPPPSAPAATPAPAPATPPAPAAGEAPAAPANVDISTPSSG